jgi:hypothetical protein
MFKNSLGVQHWKLQSSQGKAGDFRIFLSGVFHIGEQCNADVSGRFLIMRLNKKYLYDDFNILSCPMLDGTGVDLRQSLRRQQSTT